MGVTTIEWTSLRLADGTTSPGYTFNPWRGCTKVSQGCKFCYAETLGARNPGVLGVWGPQGSRPVASQDYWRQPLRWNREAQAAGVRRRVFCASLADVFEGEDTMPEPDRRVVAKARIHLLALIFETPHLDWLLLTKRPQNILPQLEAARDALQLRSCGLSPEVADQTFTRVSLWLSGHPPANVWLGTSVEDQAAADARIPHLLKAPAAVRFLSAEPLLAPVDLSKVAVHDGADGVSRGLDVLNGCQWWCSDQGEHAEDIPRINWVIVGGESGPNARPMHPHWARGLRDQCVEAGIPFLFKQWGEWLPVETFPYGGWRYQTATGRKPETLSLALCKQIVLGSKWVGQTCDALRVGKKTAGRTLDGRTWDEVPVPSAALATRLEVA